MNRYSNGAQEVQSQQSFSRFMSGIYAWVAGGLLISALTVFFLMYSYNPVSVAFWNLIVATNGMVIYGFIILELVLVFTFRFNPENIKSKANYVVKYLLYAMVNGITLSLVVFSYTDASVFNAFISTVGLFAVLSVIGFTTKKDLSKLGGILLSMLLGLIIASLVNIFFLHSSVGDLVLSIITVVIFVGLTAYDTQKCRYLYQEFAGSPLLSRLSIGLALELYLDFINLFLSILRIFGKRK